MGPERPLSNNVGQTNNEHSSIDRQPLEAPQKQQITNQDKVIDYLSHVVRDDQSGFEYSTAYFEIQLQRIQLLAGLEIAGILPTAKDPNPFDPSLEEEQHELWWKEHPQEARTFEATYEKRQEVLRYLYGGTVLGSLYGRDLFPPSETMIKESLNPLNNQ